MVYTISLPFSYLGKLSKLHFHLSFSVTVFVSTSVPFDLRRIVIESGRLRSRLCSSFQVFLPSTVTFTGVCVFVIVYPFSGSPSINTAYVPSPSVPVITSVLTSSTVYKTVLPSFIAYSSVNDPLQLFVSDSTRVFSVSVPSANSLTLIDSGRIASLLLSSSHTLVTVICVLSGV